MRRSGQHWRAYLIAPHTPAMLSFAFVAVLWQNEFENSLGSSFRPVTVQCLTVAGQKSKVIVQQGLRRPLSGFLNRRSEVRVLSGVVVVARTYKNVSHRRTCFVAVFVAVCCKNRRRISTGKAPGCFASELIQAVAFFGTCILWPGGMNFLYSSSGT